MPFDNKYKEKRDGEHFGSGLIRDSPELIKPVYKRRKGANNNATSTTTNENNNNENSENNDDNDDNYTFCFIGNSIFHLCLDLLTDF